MSGDLSKLPDSRLTELLVGSNQVLSSLSQSLATRPDMQNAIRQLMSPEDMLETFSELAVKEPDLMRLGLPACVAALVNVENMQAVDAELNRRAIAGN